MTIKERLEQDLKTALLSGDRLRIDTLRGLKSAILYAEVEVSGKDRNLPEPEVIRILAKEAKKRQESADIYNQAHETDRAEQELHEKAIIEEYLPPQLSEDEISRIVDKVIAELQSSDRSIGIVIARVKEEAGATADGALIARLVKERL